MGHCSECGRCGRSDLTAGGACRAPGRDPTGERSIPARAPWPLPPGPHKSQRHLAASQVRRPCLRAPFREPARETRCQSCLSTTIPPTALGHGGKPSRQPLHGGRGSPPAATRVSPARRGAVLLRSGGSRDSSAEEATRSGQGQEATRSRSHETTHAATAHEQITARSSARTRDRRHDRTLERVAVPHESDVLSPTHGAPNAVLALGATTGGEGDPLGSERPVRQLRARDVYGSGLHRLATCL